MQQIIHTQEEPNMRMVYLIPADEPITARIYIIADEGYVTMLFAEEYWTKKDLPTTYYSRLSGGPSVLSVFDKLHHRFLRYLPPISNTERR